MIGALAARWPLLVYVASVVLIVCAVPRYLGNPGVRRAVRTRTYVSVLVREHPGESIRDVRIAVIAVWHSVLDEGSPRLYAYRRPRGTNTLVILYQTSGFGGLKCLVRPDGVRSVSGGDGVRVILKGVSDG